MDRFGEHIDNKFGGCDIPYNGETKQQDAEQQFQQAIESINKLAKKLAEYIVPVINNAMAVVKDISNSIMHYYPNKRVVHLAFHGKYRVRKKNIRRIQKWLQIGGKNDCI